MDPKLYLVIDFEATCADDGSVPREQMEIIEIGAILADATTFEPVDEFQSFVKPRRHPRLTAFCTKLTTITQADVDSAPPFSEFVHAFRNWLYRHQDFVFCSWGNYDRSQLIQDCKHHDVPYPIGSTHLNVKTLFAERQGLPKATGLGQAVRLAGLEFAGTAHRGIDDARNITRLLPYIFGDARLTASASPRR